MSHAHYLAGKALGRGEMGSRFEYSSTQLESHSLPSVSLQARAAACYNTSSAHLQTVAGPIRLRTTVPSLRPQLKIASQYRYGLSVMVRSADAEIARERRR